MYNPHDYASVYAPSEYDSTYVETGAPTAGDVQDLLSSSRIEPLSALGWRAKSGWRVPPRTQPFSYLYVVRSGSGVIRDTDADVDRTFRPGSTMLLPENLRHSIDPHPASNVNLLAFHFRLRYLGAIDAFQLLDIDGIVTHGDSSWIEPLSLELCAAYAVRQADWRQTVGSGLRLILSAVIHDCQLDRRFSKNEIQSGSLIRLLPALRLIDRRLGDPELRIHDLASEVNVSEVYLRSLFRDCLGQSPVHFLLSRRLDRAREALLNTNGTVESIALACGFHSQSHFHRQFKARFGASPSQLRRAPGV